MSGVNKLRDILNTFTDSEAIVASIIPCDIYIALTDILLLHSFEI